MWTITWNIHIKSTLSIYIYMYIAGVVKHQFKIESNTSLAKKQKYAKRGCNLTNKHNLLGNIKLVKCSIHVRIWNLFSRISWPVSCHKGTGFPSAKVRFKATYFICCVEIMNHTFVDTSPPPFLDNYISHLDSIERHSVSDGLHISKSVKRQSPIIVYTRF